MSHIQLDQYLLSGDLIQIRRSCDPYLMSGYLVGLSDRLAVMKVFYDFHPDGFHVFSPSDVEECRCSESEKHWDFMLRSEGLVENELVDAGIPLTSIEDAAGGIQDRYGRLVVEAEGPGNPECTFAIGSLANIRDGVMQFDGFDVEGEWYDDTTEIACDTITKLQYMTPYINNYWKYLKGTPASKARL